MSKEKLDHFKKLLEEERDKLRKDLGVFANKTENPDDFESRHDELGTHEDESSTEVEEYIDDLSVESNLEQRLKDTEAALERVENGTYGVCEDCGEMIKEERLEVYPSAKTCIKCGQ